MLLYLWKHCSVSTFVGFTRVETGELSTDTEVEKRSLIDYQEREYS